MTSTEHGHRHDDPDGQEEILDLDAEVLAEQLASIVAWLPLRSAPRRIVDLGAGTGAGTFALLDHFPDARATAVDSSADHLRRVRQKASRAGVDDRVETVQADLDVAWPDLGTADLVWASASLHHMADPGRTLREIRQLVAPGGLLAVVELAGLPRFLPEDAPANRPGLEARCHAAADRRAAEHMPHRGADWGVPLAAAGYTVEARRTVAVDDGRPHSEAVGRYALLVLRRMRDALAGELDADDLAALDELLDTDGPGSILRRDDLVVRTDRTVWAARP
ncbi:class I SAM-dependent methyltransferase [Pseudonocardia sichuanensis]